MASANTNNPTIWTFLYLKEDFHLTVSWQQPYIDNNFTWINPVKLVSRSIQCSEFCFQYRSFLFTSIMIQSLGKLKGWDGEIITYWGSQYWFRQKMMFFSIT